MGRTRRGTWLFVCVLSLSLIVAAGAPTLVTADPASTPQPDREGAGTVVVQQEDAENNTSVQHENPDKTNEDGDLGAVQQWLGDDLGSYLEESSLQLSQGQYEAARDALGDEYTDSLGKFVDVAGETQESTDNEESTSPEEQERALNETRETQREYVNTTESFWETYEAYQAAKDAGNETRARELARRLNAQGDQIAGLTGELRIDYRTVENITGTSLSSAFQRINQTTANVTAVSESIVVAEFVRTRLTVSREAATASFSDPVTVTGHIETPANVSTAPPTGTVTLQIENRRLETTVNDDGTFSIDYRPVTVQAGQRTLELRYVPQPESIYLDSTANTSLTIEPVTPTVDVDSAEQPLSFGQPTGVTGRVTVNGTPVPDLPLAVRIAGVPIQTVETGPSGRFESTAPLPATITTGMQPLSVSVALDDRAIAATRTNQTVSVAETQTTISLDGEWTTDGVSLSGQLASVDGVAVPGQSIRILTNGTHKTTVQTTSDGTFRAAFSPSQALAEEGLLNVTVVYVGAETNLANATERTRLQPPSESRNSGQTQSNGNSQSTSVVQRVANQDNPWLIVGLVGLGIIGGVYWWRRRAGSATVESANDVAAGSTGPAVDDHDESEAESEPSPLQPARDALDAEENPDHAVRLAFSTVREAIVEADDSVDVTDNPLPVTHWGFYRAAKDAVPDDDALRALTEAYEHAQYAGEQSSLEDAEDAIETAAAILAPLQTGQDHSSS